MMGHLQPAEMLPVGILGQKSEVDDQHQPDEQFQLEDEFQLGDHVGFAGFVNQFADLQHRAMHRHVFQAVVDDQAEDQAKSADDQTEFEQDIAGDAVDGRGERWNVQVGVAGAGILRCQQ